MALQAWIVLGLAEFVILGFITAKLVNHYASKFAPFYSLLTVFIAWYLGFFGTLFLPIDIAEAYASLQFQARNETSVVFPSPSPSPGWVAGANTSLTPMPWPSAPAWNGTNATATALVSVTGSSVPSPTSTTSSVAVEASSNSTASSTPSGTGTAAPTGTPTGTPTGAGTIVPSQPPPSASPTGSDSPTPSGTGTGSGTPSPSGTGAPSTSSTATRTGTPRASGASVTPTSTRTRSATPTRSPMSSPTSTRGTSPSRTPSPTGTTIYDRLLRGVDSHRQAGAMGGSELEGLHALMDEAAFARRLQTGAEGSPSPSGGPLIPVFSPPATGTVSPSPLPTPSNSSTPAGNGTVIWKVDLIEFQVRNGPLESMWFFVYWATFVLTYLIIPVVQEYVAAGQFTRRARLIESVRINLVFYAVCVVIATGALAYVVLGLGQTLWDLLPVLTSLANTLGLAIIVPLLGYGAAQLPRTLWNKADPESELRRLYFRASELDSSLFDAKGELGDTVKDIAEFGSKLTGMAGDKEYAAGDKAEKVKELQRCYAVVLRKVALARDVLGPSFGAAKEGTAGAAAASERRKALEKKSEDEELEDEKAEAGWLSSMGKMLGGGGSKYKGVNPHKLAKLHKKVMAQVFKVKKQTYRWEALVQRCVELEYIVGGTVPPVPQKRKTADGGTYYVVPSVDSLGAKGVTGAGKGGATNAVPRGGVASGARDNSSGGKVIEDGMEEMSEKAAHALMGMMLCPTLAGGFFNRVLWNFNMHARPLFFKSLCVACEAMSLALLWSEATIWINLSGLVKDNLSIFGRILEAAGQQGYMAIQLAAAIPLAYMCACSTYAVFRIKLFDMLDLSGGQNTDPYSLLVNASLFNRLQFSLAFNYLNVLMHSRDKTAFPDTAFLHSVGAKMSLSVVDWFLPCLTVVIYALVKANVFDRIVKYVFGVEDRGEPKKGDRDDESLIREGAIVVSRGRRTLGLGGGADAGMTEEDRKKQEALSRDRIAAVLARAAARRAGIDPDSVAKLDDEMAAGMSSDHGYGPHAGGEGLQGPGGEGGYASGGSFLSSKQGMFKLSEFGSAEGAPAGAAGGGSGGGAGLLGLGKGLGGLGDLAKKAKLDKLGSALGVGAGATAPGADQQQQQQSQAQDDSAYEGSWAVAGGSTGSGSGGQAQAQGYGGSGRGRSMSGGGAGRYGHGSPPQAPVVIEEAPTLAQLLRGKRPGEPTIGPARAGPEGGVPGYGKAAAAAAQRQREAGVSFDFQVGGTGGSASFNAQASGFRTPPAPARRGASAGPSNR